MDAINLALAIAGLLLGLISAWPKLSAWANFARKRHTERSRRSEHHRALQFRLAIEDTGYLVAYVLFNLAAGAGLAVVGYLLKQLNIESGWATIVLFIRLGIYLVVGNFLGYAIGTSFFVMRHKQAAAGKSG
jgi:hypothetical protein